MTARVRRPLVASTSLVLPLALSINRFTGSESRATMATMWFATTTLPWPTLTSRGGAPFCLLKILNLLANLLQGGLGRQRRLAHVEIVGLGAHGVHLAIQLLQQEVELAAERAAFVEEKRELRQMCAQAGELLRDVGLVRPDGRFGEQARVVDRRVVQERAQPVAQPFLLARSGGRRARGHGRHVRGKVRVQAAQLLLEALALGGAAGHQLVERAGERIGEDRPRRRRLQRLAVGKARD